MRGIAASRRRKVETSREKGGGLKSKGRTVFSRPVREAPERRRVAREGRAFRPSLRASSLLMSGQRLANYFWSPFGVRPLGWGRNSHFRHLWPFLRRQVPSCSVASRAWPVACPLHGLQVASRSDFGLDVGPGKLHFGMQFLILQRCLYSFVFLNLFQRFCLGNVVSDRWRAKSSHAIRTVKTNGFC